LKLANKGLLVIFVPLFCQVVLTGFLVFFLFRAKEELAQHAHTDAVYFGCNNVVKGLASSTTVESIFTGAQLDSTDNATILQQMETFGQGTRVLKEELASEPSHNPNLIERLNTAAQQCSTVMAQTYEALQFGGPQALSASNVERLGFDSAASLMYVLDDICEHEMELEEQREEERSEREGAWRMALIAVALLGLGVSVGAAIWCINHIRNRLNILQENTRRFAQRKPLIAADPGTDELAMLDRVFHALDASIDEVTQRERAMINNAAELICSIDRNAIFERVNSFSTTLLGRAPESLVGATVLDVVAKDDIVKANDEFNVASAHEGVHSFELQLQPVGKDAVDTSWSTFWSERDRSLFCVVSDVTERNKIERLKEDFVAMISHDLRTPLMSLSIDISLLMRAAENLSSSANDELLEAETTVQQLIRFVNDLLDFEKLQAGKMQYFNELISVDSLVVNAAAELFEQAKPRNIEVSVTSNCLRTIEGDREKLGQLTTNLLTNAMSRTPDGGTIQVGAWAQETNVTVEVTDSGTNVYPEFAEKIFTPFSQGMPGSSRESGLELAICKLIVEGHGGKTGVRQGDGETTVFWFSLPAPAVVPDDDQ
jgi:PAS domain S-box-containing protein